MPNEFIKPQHDAWWERGHVLCLSWSIWPGAGFWWVRVWRRVLVAEHAPRALTFSERVGAVKYYRWGKQWRWRIER